MIDFRCVTKTPSIPSFSLYYVICTKIKSLLLFILHSLPLRLSPRSIDFLSQQMQRRFSWEIYWNILRWWLLAKYFRVGKGWHILVKVSCIMGIEKRFYYLFFCVYVLLVNEQTAENHEFILGSSDQIIMHPS